MTRKFTRFCIPLIVLMALVFAPTKLMTSAQGAQVAREDTVIFDIDATSIGDPFNFNILDNSGGQLPQNGLHQAVLEPLFILNYETGKIEPYLGTSFTSNSALDVWTLKLRDGVTWSDGVPFSADDVVFTVQTLLDDKTATLRDAANMQTWVKAVKKIDASTVEFDLTAPDPRFQLDYFSVRIWGNFNIVPEHIYKGQDPATFKFYDPAKGWPVGTGPYKLTSASPTQFVYDEDPNWWGAKTGFHALPEPKRVEWVLAGSPQNKALLMSNHQLDSAMNIPLTAFQAIQAKNPNVIAWKDALPYAWADPCPRELEFNTEQAPWNDANLRKAVSLIVDRSQNIKIAYQGTTTASSTIFVSYGGMQTYIDAVVKAGYGAPDTADVAGGQKLIEAAGYKLNGSGIYEKDGKTLDLAIIVPNDTQEYTLSNNDIVEQLQKAGINASSQPVNGATETNDNATGNYQAEWQWHTCGSVSEPWVSLNQLNVKYYKPTGTLGAAGLDSERWNTDGAKAYSKIVDQIGSLPLGDPSVPGLVAQAYKYIYDETPVIPLVQAEKLVPFDTTYWTNWPTAKNNYNHPATWWNSTYDIILNLHKATKK
jgi:peptide/nickel transport system substrate-binding protein